MSTSGFSGTGPLDAWTIRIRRYRPRHHPLGPGFHASHAVHIHSYPLLERLRHINQPCALLLETIPEKEEPDRD